MSALPLTKPENISNLLNLDQEYPAPYIVARSVLQKNCNEAREHALNDPAGFWSGYAEQFEWSKPWSKVLEWDGMHHNWFLGAKTNITINALDRHANSELRIAPPSSGSVKRVANASSLTASFTVRSAVLRTA